MITPETHDHALNCETTLGRGCDCGLTGMAGVACYVEGAAVYKTPVERSASIKTPLADYAAAHPEKSITEIGEEYYRAKSSMAEVTDFLRRKRRANWGDTTEVPTAKGMDALAKPLPTAADAREQLAKFFSGRTFDESAKNVGDAIVQAALEKQVKRFPIPAELAEVAVLLERRMAELRNMPKTEIILKK